MYSIKFYRTNEPYGCFSNFAEYPIDLNGRLWPTNEHFIQAQKFVGTDYEEEIRLASTAMEAAKMGRDRNHLLRKDWEDCKDDVMHLAILTKIEQHKTVKDILLSTGNCTLVEHTRSDAYWVDNGDGTGKNMLGIILMKIRASIKEFDGRFFLPQWLAYPDIHPDDMFWRMGTGEIYVIQFAEWFYSLTQEAQNEYNRYFIPPKEWEENET